VYTTSTDNTASSSLYVYRLIGYRAKNKRFLRHTSYHVDGVPNSFRQRSPAYDFPVSERLYYTSLPSRTNLGGGINYPTAIFLGKINRSSSSTSIRNSSPSTPLTVCDNAATHRTRPYRIRKCFPFSTRVNVRRDPRVLVASPGPETNTLRE